MSPPSTPGPSRRQVLALALGGGVLTITGCRTPASTPTPSPASPSTPASNRVQVLLSQSEYGDSLLDDVRSLLAARTPAIEVQTTNASAADAPAQLLAPTPPDALLSGGWEALSLAEIAPWARALDTEAPDLGLVAGATTAGRVGEHVVAVPLVHEVRGLWYSSSLFRQRGWRLPATWADLLGLGRLARPHGLYLFAPGRETALDLARMVVASAIKQGGEPVRTAMDALAPGCWALAPVQLALQALEQLVQEGLVRPGAGDSSGDDALARWARDQDCLLYPGGSAVPWRTRRLAGDDFGLALVPDPALDGDPALGAKAAQLGFGSWLAVGRTSASPDGALAVLRTLLSPEVAGRFTSEHFALSTVADANGSPTSAHGRAGLAAQQDLVQAADGADCSWRAPERFGIGPDVAVLVAGLLDESLDLGTLIRELQSLSDDVRG